jgi:hypothetical protein
MERYAFWFALAVITMAMSGNSQATEGVAHTGQPPAFKEFREKMKAEHEAFDHQWAECKKIADGTQRATCYEKWHDDVTAAMEAHKAEFERVRAERHRESPTD